MIKIKLDNKSILKIFILYRKEYDSVDYREFDDGNVDYREYDDNGNVDYYEYDDNGPVNNNNNSNNNNHE